MSWQSSEAVWKHSQHIKNNKMLMLAIARFTDKDGHNAWPSIDTLAKMLNLEDRSIKRLIKQCEESGELVVKRGCGRGNSSTYSINLPHPDDDPDDEKGDPGGIKGDPGGIKGDRGITFSVDKKGDPGGIKGDPGGIKGDPGGIKGDRGITRSFLDQSIDPSEDQSEREEPSLSPEQDVEQRAWEAAQELVAFWCDLVGDVPPTTRQQQDEILWSHYGPLILLWQRVRDVARAKGLLQDKYQEMLRAKLRPRKPAAVVPQIVGDMNASELVPAALPRNVPRGQSGVDEFFQRLEDMNNGQH